MSVVRSGQRPRRNGRAMDWVWIAALSWLGLSLPAALLIGYYLRRCGDGTGHPHTMGGPEEASATITPVLPGPSKPRARRARTPSPALARSVHPPGYGHLRSKKPGTAAEDVDRTEQGASGGDDANPGTPSPPAGARRRSRLHRHQ